MQILGTESRTALDRLKQYCQDGASTSALIAKMPEYEKAVQKNKEEIEKNRMEKKINTKPLFDPNSQFVQSALEELGERE